MRSANVTTTQRTIIALFVLAILTLWATFRIQISYDLTAFLPAPQTNAQTVLSERLGQGPGAQLIFVSLPSISKAQARTLANRIRQSPHFAQVFPDDRVASIEDIPEVLWANRLLLGNLPEDKQAWLEVLLERSDDLMFGADQALMQLIAADPALLALLTISDFTSAAAQPAYDFPNRQILLVESRAPSFDIGAQTQAVQALRTLTERFPGSQLFGSSVYAVDLQSSVRNEATLFSMLASFALLGFIIWRFRKWQHILGVAIPLACGGAAGAVALTLAFESVHGITLAFGFTLLGVAIDYPLHVYAHRLKEQAHNPADIWPTLRVGICSTLIAYAAFLLSGTTGLQQLGLFAVTGILVAAITCAWMSNVGPSINSNIKQSLSKSEQPLDSNLHLYLWPSALLTGLMILVGMNMTLFKDDLSSLTPIAADVLKQDAALRSQMGVTDLRYLISVHTTDLQENLLANETVFTALTPLLVNNDLQGARSIVQLLPSETTQQQRNRTLQEPTSLAEFQSAAADAEFSDDAFNDFIQYWQTRSQASNQLTLKDLSNDPHIGSAVSSMIYPSGDGWTSLIYLQGIRAPQQLLQLLADHKDAQLVDLKATANEMVASYRNLLLALLAVAISVIFLLITWLLNFKRAIWSLFTVLAAVCVSALTSAWLQGGLSLFDIMALALVAGLGLDYALFYGRADTAENLRATDGAVQVCAISSLLVFLVLACSSIPVLQGLGTTVSIGVIAAYLLARFGRHRNAEA